MTDAQTNSAAAQRAIAVAEHIARSLGDEPEAVSVEQSEGRIDVRVAAGDLGRVIGKRGKTANAFRTVVRAAAYSDGVERVDIEFAS